jgi:uncharacterized protein YjbI with pentapeptide repeats
MTVEQRLERLERQNRGLRRAVIGVVAVGLSLLVMRQILPDRVHDVVRARLTGANLKGTSLVGAIFQGANLENTILQDKSLEKFK